MAIAIGDIHGRLAYLKVLVGMLPPDEELVFLGDYVDRGPNSAQVLTFLTQLREERPVVLLMGNHERMMADAIEDTEKIRFWLLNGGKATLKSYGVDPLDFESTSNRAACVPGFLEFYRGLRHYHEDEHAIYVHAGIDVGEPDMTRQRPEVMLWTRDPFIKQGPQWQGKPIIFGHTPTQYLGEEDGGVYQSGKLYGVDTGCVYGGPLSGICSRTFRVYQTPFLEG